MPKDGQDIPKSTLAPPRSQSGCDQHLEGNSTDLVALGIAVSTRCDACIGFHVRTLVRLGTTKAEFEEVLGMAVYMGGGPSLMYAANAMAAFE